MKALIELSQEDIYEAIVEFIQNRLDFSIDSKDVIIETKSKQNYKAEWETALIRAQFHSKPKAIV
jgi:predicted nucleic-acid-binding protein